MSSRILALSILILFLVFPIGLYWYFYEQKVTAMIFQSESKDPYTVSLQGSLEYTYFPLLDQAFSYESTCVGSCIFSPVPPLKYAVRISSDGRESIEDTVTLTAGESYKYSVSLVPTFSLEKITTLPLDDRVRTGGFLGLDIEGESVFLKYDIAKRKMGLFFSEKTSPFILISLPATRGGLDMSRSYALLSGNLPEQYIYSLSDKTENIIFPYEDEIMIVTHDPNWKVRTRKSLYEYIGGSWGENPRFTDYIDISSRYRIGYIDASDTEKLSLQNLDTDTSVFLLLDRQSAHAEVIKKGYNIQGFLSHKGKPSIIDTNGVISNITIDLDK